MVTDEYVCALCGKPLSAATDFWADVDIDYPLQVGPDCHKRILAAGKEGVMGPNGHRLYPEGQYPGTEEWLREQEKP